MECYCSGMLQVWEVCVRACACACVFRQAHVLKQMRASKKTMVMIMVRVCVCVRGACPEN